LRVFLDEMGDDLRVRFRNKLVAFLLKFFFEFEIVFDDAVVHHDNVARAIAVRVSILLGGTSVSGPAGVTNAVSAFDGRLGDGFFQIAKFSRRAADFEFAGAVHDGDAGGVVAAVFEFAKALDNHGNDFFGTDVSEDSAHLTVFTSVGYISLTRSPP
jgi:hypothetical protein